MRAKAQIVVALVISAVGSVALGLTYFSGDNPQLEGLFLAVALGGLGWATVATAHLLLDKGPATEARHDLGSTTKQIDQVEEDLRAPTTRRGFIIGAFGGAIGALGVAALLPLRSLGRGPGRPVSKSAWQRGMRLVDGSGQPITVDDLALGGAVTAFPEGHMADADSIVILVRLDPSTLRLPSSRLTWAPDGYVAYSKVCTHAGCPVGLFDGDTGLLTCPCHQSAFQTRTGADPTSGPAARPLPQLPLDIDAEGVLVAAGEMSQPVGPGYWEQSTS
ncbi:MAG: Rieske 2Fe-2S domain-containing protein [Acidimicrobiia bacterium]